MKYYLGRILTVSYWRDHDKELTNQGYKLSIVAEQASSPASLSGNYLFRFIHSAIKPHLVKIDFSRSHAQPVL